MGTSVHRVHTHTHTHTPRTCTQHLPRMSSCAPPAGRPGEGEWHAGVAAHGPKQGWRQQVPARLLQHRGPPAVQDIHAGTYTRVLAANGIRGHARTRAAHTQRTLHDAARRSWDVPTQDAHASMHMHAALGTRQMQQTARARTQRTCAPRCSLRRN